MKTSTILLVEDNADDAELAMRAFERTPVKTAFVLVDFSEFVRTIHQVGADRLQVNQPAPPT